MMSNRLDNHKKPKAMIFDLDGTLFRTESLLLPAYEATFEQMRREGSYEGETPPKERILGALGMLLEHIWERVLPESPASVRKRADELLLHYQSEGLKQGAGSLYDDVAETLQELRRRGLRLFIASNGLEDYVKQVPAGKGIASLFDGFYSAGEYQTRSKVDLVRLLVQQHNIKSAWMVGDRSSDVEAGHANGFPVIGCDYAGFGKDSELAQAEMRITCFTDIITLLDK